MNGYGEHNIQGIGDKHIPLIHNVMNTDFVVGVSDAGSDALNLLFNDRRRPRAISRSGRTIDPALVRALGELRPFQHRQRRRRDQAREASRARRIRRRIVTSRPTARRCMAASARVICSAATIRGGFDEVNAGEIFGQHLQGIADDHVNELDARRQRKRIFNLGYYTWVEQQGIAVEDFDRRKQQPSGRACRRPIPAVGQADHAIQRGQRRPSGMAVPA